MNSSSDQMLFGKLVADVREKFGNSASNRVNRANLSMRQVVAETEMRGEAH